MDLTSFLQLLRSAQLPAVASYEHFTQVDDASNEKAVILIGCGSWNISSGSRSTPLIVQNKGAAQHLGKGFSSLVKMLADPAGSYVEEWFDSNFAANRDLTQLLRNIEIVAEDGSPDSIFAFLLLLGRFMGVPLDLFPRNWIDAVDEWERTGTVDDPFRSWCALESALAHASIIPEDSSRTYSVAWQAGISFAVMCLQHGLDPLGLPTVASSAIHTQALNALELERQSYLDWLQRVPQLQLALPVMHFPSRRKLVDALFIDEIHITGASKVFYRSDRLNSPLKEGFTLSLVFRPTSIEAHPDITISVDPRRQVSLLALWEKLEEAESSEWLKTGEVRPSDNIRPLDGVRSRFNQPWFINSDHTLVGSPRKLQQRFAGRLTWEKVQNLVLQECNPLRQLMVSNSKEETPKNIFSFTPEQRRQASPGSGQDEKTFLMVCWPSVNYESGVFLHQELPTAPTALQMLAGVTQPGREQGEITMSDLPPPTAFDQVKLTGGMAIVSDWGVFILDDWTKDRLDKVGIRSAFESAADLHARLKTHLEIDLPELTSSLRTLLLDQSVSGEVHGLSKQLSVLSLEVAELRGGTSIVPSDYNARLLREAMDRRWTLEKRLAGLESGIKAVDAAIKNLVEVRNALITRFITVYGFALFLASGLASSLGKTIYHYAIPERPATDPPGLWVLLTFLALAAILFVLLRLWIQTVDPLKADPNAFPSIYSRRRQKK